MMNRFGLDRFKKAQSVEPFSVNSNGAKLVAPPYQTSLNQSQPQPQAGSTVQSTQSALTATGGGASSWQPPEWAVEPKPGLYWLDVVKDCEVVDKIGLEKRRFIFGRQILMCDYVLDHPSVSRQHAAVVQHKNGSIYVVDQGSVHGTFVANERLSKDNPVELEVGQSLRFAASTRSYVLRKAVLQPFSVIQRPIKLALPPPPDPSDEEALVAYNTVLNRMGGQRADTYSNSNLKSLNEDERSTEVKSGEEERRAKKPRKARVTFRDTHDGVLVEVVGYSDGADVGTEPGPIGVREGSLIGKYESLVQVTVIPKNQQSTKLKIESDTSKGVTQRLQQYLDKVKSPGKGGGLYGDLYGGSLSGVVGGSWAGVANVTKTFVSEAEAPSSANDFSDQMLFSGFTESSTTKALKTQDGGSSGANFISKAHEDFADDDLFGDSGFFGSYLQNLQRNLQPKFSSSGFDCYLPSFHKLLLMQFCYNHKVK